MKELTKFLTMKERSNIWKVLVCRENLAIPAIILEILFPLLLIIGYQTKIAALVMAIFTIVVAIIFHPNFDDHMQFIIFFKDIAIAGGFYNYLG
ncbi:MAG: hypothetical protein Ct9H300mP5_2930 [Candidatus Pelagibacterales bacterium]|nr:MAG: hypothetical protein Ct9H300mP5_2930 [Pelagibacterales bacterium]